MEFPNAQIHLLDIPSIDDVNFEPLENNYRKVLLFSNMIFFGIFLTGSIVAYFAADAWFVIFIPIAILLIAIISVSLINISFKRKGLAVRQKDIIYKSGLIFRKITTVPFNRIQHVEINQGPIEKRFDLSKLEIYTAGGAASDLKIPGLKYENAQKLRAFIIQKTRSDEEE